MRAVAAAAVVSTLLPLAAAATQYTPHGFGCLDPSQRGLPYCDPAQPLAARVADLLSRLTPAEKIGLTGSSFGDLCSVVDSGVPRLFIPNVTQLIEVTGAVSSACYVDAAGASYCPTVFPAPLSLAASFDRRTWRLKGAVTGTEARAFNNLHVGRIYEAGNYVDLLAFGPDINLIVDPRNGRAGENPSEDPTLAAAYAVEVTRGMQEGEDSNYLLMSSALKHYAGYEREANRFASDDNISNFDLLDTYLVPFAAGMRSVGNGGGASSGTMCSYNSINGVPACADSWLLTAMVREYWQRPDAYHMSDCGAIEDEYTAKHWASSYADATARSLNAGCDGCIGTAFQQAGGLAAALAAGSVSAAALDASLGRLLSQRFKLGMFDPPNATVYTTYGPERIATAEAARAARVAAARGAVLLRNDGGVLPLRAGALRKLAVVGPHAVTQRDLLGDFYGDAFCPGINNKTARAAGCVPTFGAAAAEWLAGANPAASVAVAAGCDVACADGSGIAEAVAAAADADAVLLMLGYSNAAVEQEGADHAFITLPGQQGALADAVIAAAAARGAPCVLVLVNAGQIALDTLAVQPPALVEAFYPGFGALEVVAQIFGATNSWGRLPYTIYPAAFAAAINLSDTRVSTGVGRTWRYYGGAAGAPLHSFGDGLSFTAFATSCAASGGSSFPAGSAFEVPLDCATALAAGATLAGDEVLLLSHRAGADVRAAIAGAHPVPRATLRDFARLDGVNSTQGSAAWASAFVVRPGDLALVNAVGASVLYPGTHYVDVAGRPPAQPFTLTITLTGAAPVVLAAPPPLPPPA